LDWSWIHDQMIKEGLFDAINIRLVLAD
jgi:hypothetical protein